MAKGFFREKSLETIESPESLNDYLRVTSPGVWGVLAAVICLLVGVVIWGFFGHIDTSIKVAVVSDGTKISCVVPYESLESIVGSGVITIDGTEYKLEVSNVSEPATVSQTSDSYILIYGDYKVGDVVVEIPVDASLGEGMYTGHIVTEHLTPASLLL